MHAACVLINNLLQHTTQKSHNQKDMWEVGVCMVALLVVLITHWVYSWSNPKCKNGKLPPGSMGFPIIGETLEFFSPYSSSHDLPPFIKKRMAKYGSLFRTNLIGQNTVVSTDNEINYSIFQQENKSIQLWYTDSLAELIVARDKIMFAHDGKLHSFLRKLVLHVIGPEKLRGHVLQEMDEITRRHLQSWAGRGTVDIKHGASEVAFEFSAKKLMSYDEEKDQKKLLESSKLFVEGIFSFPLNIPGTTFHASLKGRKKVIKVIEDIYQDRKTSKVPAHDFLDYLLEEMEKEDTFLNDTAAVNLIFGMLFAAQESTSQAVALLANFVFDHPNVLMELTKEHETIIRKRDGETTGITWEEYKSMTFTHMVVNETIRLGNITPGIFRKVVKDLKINGYTIPTGWIIMAIPSVVHLNSDKYDNPFTFNPWRWQGQELNKGSKTFMGFGCGVRLCAGADFAKLQMAIFLHYLVTRYKWSVINVGDFVRKPHVSFPNGLHIRIAEEHKS